MQNFRKRKTNIEVYDFYTLFYYTHNDGNRHLTPLQYEYAYNIAQRRLKVYSQARHCDGSSRTCENGLSLQISAYIFVTYTASKYKMCNIAVKLPRRKSMRT